MKMMMMQTETLLCLDGQDEGEEGTVQGFYSAWRLLK